MARDDASDDIADAFRDPDRAGEPEELVRFLDAVSGDAGIQAAKRENLALLELRAGDRALDVGCGTGGDVLALAEIIGANGIAVGVDRSAQMIAAAWRTASGQAARFAVADVAALPFADGAFHGVYAERLFAYVDDPARALAEMVRVTASGGRIVVSDVDLGAQAFDIEDRALFRTFWQHREDVAVANGWIGRQLPRLFHAAGLVDLRIVPRVHVTWQQPPVEFVRQMRVQTQAAVEAGVLSADDGERWLATLDERIAQDTWFNTFNHFVVAGMKS